MPNRPGSVGSAIVWMFLLSILLFWLPFIGSLLAGFVGGRKAGNLGNAILAVFSPGLIFGFALFFLGSVLAGRRGRLCARNCTRGPLLLGAIIGALV
jgi:hypothetical protein